MDGYTQLIATSLQGKPTAGGSPSWLELINNEDPVTVQNDPSHGRETSIQGSAYPDPDGEGDESIGPYYGSSEDGQSSRSPRLRLSTPDEAVQASDDDYQYEENSEDSCVINEKRSTWVTKEGSAISKRASRHPDAPVVSKLQAKKQHHASQGIELDSNGTRKGVVRGGPGSLKYLHNHEWIPAVYHHEIRQKLLQMTDKKGKYDEEPASGADELDRTAFKAEQQHISEV
ncbi:MAG: hypothetical protein Q9225_003484 [Loekoesia sp. 1 TL-2023]